VLIEKERVMTFNPLAVTGYLDIKDIPDWHDEEKRNIPAVVRQAIEGRKRNRYRHLVFLCAGMPDIWKEQMLIETNRLMAKLKEEGYTIDDERGLGSDPHRSQNTYWWTIMWKDG